MTQQGNTDQVRSAIEEVDNVLSELKACLDTWNRSGWNLTNSRKYRSIAKRIVLASRSLEEVVKENTFSRP